LQMRWWSKNPFCNLTQDGRYVATSVEDTDNIYDSGIDTVEHQVSARWMAAESDAKIMVPSASDLRRVAKSDERSIE
jgi:hypothetical protein